MYWTIFLVLFLFMCIEMVDKKINRIYFNVSYVILTLLITLRQGQGTDYYNYHVMYNTAGLASTWIDLFYVAHGEIGYLLLNYIAIRCGISYTLFAALFSLVTMMVYYPFFKKECQCSMIPLFVFYITFFLLYPFSGVRQGFTIAALLSVLFPLLKEGQYSRYIITTILLATIHTSILICIIFPFIHKLQTSKTFLFYIFVFCLLFSLANFSAIIIQYLPIKSYTSDSFSYSAYIIRILVITPIFFIPDRIYQTNTDLLVVRNLLFFGFVIYTIFAYNDLVASRLNVYCRIFEGLFLFLVIYHPPLQKIREQIWIYFIVIGIAIFCNNISGFITQGHYQHCNVMTYPYFSLFDTQEEIMYYRKSFGRAGLIQ